MAESPEVELQKALVAVLRADAAVAALVGVRIYDEPPQTPVRPFIRIGNIEGAPVRTDGIETAALITFSVEGHSRPLAGRVEAARVVAAAIAALDEREADLAVAGHRLVRLQFITTATIRDSDGQSYQSNAAFEALLDRAP
ncbi:DUF3168 domain-containing protein [Wenxinia saemankumensis]|uniref:DUF3168 domain-containing protein n=1 Tax=Wenxinia saemankumensis TaxID=1447782 RepID=UPI000934AB0E